MNIYTVNIYKLILQLTRITERAKKKKKKKRGKLLQLKARHCFARKKKRSSKIEEKIKPLITVFIQAVGALLRIAHKVQTLEIYEPSNLFYCTIFAYFLIIGNL